MSEEAEKLKNTANQLFQEGKYEKAIQVYDEAIKLNPNNAIYYSNRGFANFRLERYGLFCLHLFDTTQVPVSKTQNVP